MNIKNYISFSRPIHGRREKKAVSDVLDGGWLTTGKKTQLFEKRFKIYKKTKFALALNSCTAALHLSLMLLNFKKGDEVITSALTFSSTINSIIISASNIIYLY